MPECRVFDRSHGKQAFRFLNPKHIDRSDCAKQDNVLNLKKKANTHTFSFSSGYFFLLASWVFLYS